MRLIPHAFALAASLLAVSSAAAQRAAPAPAITDPLSRDGAEALQTTYLNPASPAEFTTACDRFLARAGQLKAVIEGETGPATVATTLRRFDALTAVLGAAQSDSGVVSQTSQSAETRDAARACTERVDALSTEVSLSRAIYQRLRAIDTAALDATTRFILARSIASFERAGVAANDATREQIRTIQARLSQNATAFERNIADGRRTVTATPAELEGLPADYIAAHRPGPDGRITISTDYPDLGPVMSYAQSDDLRRRLAEANANRAYPANDQILRTIFTDRAELARLLGRPNYATLITEDKMIGSPANVERFLGQLSEVTQAPSARDAQAMLTRLRRIDPNATAVPAWSVNYLQQLIRREQYQVDPQEVRQYFAYNNVRDGILQLTRDLFGVEIRRWDTPLWAPGVEAYEIVENGQVIGRFYMDNHPRPGKYNHANVIPIRFGLEGRQIPIGILVCNFPAGDHTTGLMEHRDVETFLHEFGHLLHVIFSGRQQWTQANMLNVEWDFIEAPSQMLENWVWDYETLRRFAVNARGETIPQPLVERMNRGRGFAEAFGDRRQMGLSNVSLNYHLAAPGTGDLTQAYARAYDRYSPTPMPEGYHPQAAFGHLTGYSAIYYTYMWSKTISTDLFTAFQRAGLRDPATARRYRQQVLAPGGSRPAADLVRDFLGRPLSLDAYRARLSASSAPASTAP